MITGEGTVDGRARDREQFGQIADRVLTGVVHAAQLALLLVGELGLLAAELAAGASDRHAFTCAQADEVGLELSKCGEDVKEHLPHGIGRVVDARAERKLAPRATSSSAMARASETERASRSSFGTTSVLPARTAA